MDLGKHVENAVFLVTPNEVASLQKFGSDHKVQPKVVVAEGKNAPYEVAKGLQMLFDNAAVDKAFATLDEQIQQQVIVEMPAETRSTLAQVKDGIFAFPAVQLKQMAEKKEGEVRAAQNVVETFFKQI